MLAGVFVLFATGVFAQNNTTQTLTMGIPAISLINAVDSTGATAAVSLQLTTTTAGNAINGGTATSYAQVSTIIATGTTYKITASVTGVPSGTSLSVNGAIPTNGDGDGTFGSSAGATVLSGTDATIFTSIGSCYTGTAPKDGYILNWTWNAGASGTYADIVSTGGATAVVTLTISGS